MLGEILEGVAVEEIVAEAWYWLDRRSLAGFGLDLGWPQAVHASSLANVTKENLLKISTYFIFGH